MKSSMMVLLILLILISFGCKKEINNPTDPPISMEWKQINGLVGFNYNVSDFASYGNYLFGATRSGVFMLDAGDTNWVLKNTGLENKNINAIASIESVLFAGTGDETGYGGGVFVSTNMGDSWVKSDSGLIYTPPGFSPTIPIVTSLAVVGTNLFAGTSNAGVFLSTNSGTNWVTVNDNVLGNSNSVLCFATDGITLYAGTGNGLYSTTDNGLSWYKNPGNFDYGVLAIAILGNTLLVSNGDVNNGGFYRSTDKGSTWTTLRNYGPSNNIVQSIIFNGTNIFAGASDGVYLSKDNGNNWFDVSANSGPSLIFSFQITKNKIYASTRGSGVWWSPI